MVFQVKQEKETSVRASELEQLLEIVKTQQYRSKYRALHSRPHITRLYKQLLPSPNTYCIAHTKCSFRLNVGNAADPEQGTCLTQRPFCFLLWSSGKIHFLWQHKHNHWWCSGKFSKTKQFIPSFSPVPSQMWVKSFFTRQTFCYGNTHLWQSKTEHFFNKNGISVSLRKGRTFIWLLSACVAVQGKHTKKCLESNQMSLG